MLYIVMSTVSLQNIHNPMFAFSAFMLLGHFVLVKRCKKYTVGQIVTQVCILQRDNQCEHEL